MDRRHAAIRRRRRRLILLFGAGLLVAVGVWSLPLARRAVNDLILPLDYSSLIRQQAADKHLDPALVAAVIYAETRFIPRTSPTGAEGLMQIEPATAEYLAHRSGGVAFQVSDLGTPAVNIAYGAYYLRVLLDQFHGNRIMALAAYNGGETNVLRWLAAARAHGESFRIDDIPFPETRAYVERVLQTRADYRHTYAAQLGYR